MRKFLRWCRPQKLNHAHITFFSLFATAGIQYVVWGSNPYVLCACGVLVAHEFAHYFFAKYAGAEVKTPIFIPLLAFMSGATYIKDPQADREAMIALSGGIIGLVTVGLTAILILAFGLSPGAAMPLVGFGIYEVVSLTLGSDGKRYRHIRRRLNASINGTPR